MRPRRGGERGKCEVLISILSRHDPSTIFTLSRNEWLNECANLSMRFIRTLYTALKFRAVSSHVYVFRLLRLSSPLRLGDHACITSLTAIHGCSRLWTRTLERMVHGIIRRSRLADKTTRLVGAWPIINWPLLIRTITPECRGNYQRGAGTKRRSPSNKRTRLSRGWLTAVVIEILTSPTPSIHPYMCIYIYLA